jgi:hypothetical protein
VVLSESPRTTQLNGYGFGGLTGPGLVVSSTPNWGSQSRSPFQICGLRATPNSTFELPASHRVSFNTVSSNLRGAERLIFNRWNPCETVASLFAYASLHSRSRGVFLRVSHSGSWTAFVLRRYWRGQLDPGFSEPKGRQYNRLLQSKTMDRWRDGRSAIAFACIG